MPGKRQTYRWGLVRAGNIISFKYKTQTGDNKIQTVLVLNPRLPVTLKSGSKMRQVIGIQLKRGAKIALRITSTNVRMLNKIGTFKVLDEKNKLYTLEVKDSLVVNDVKGAKPKAFDMISKNMGIEGQYRTYDYKKAKKSAVYLEPLKVPKGLGEGESNKDKDKKPQWKKDGKEDTKPKSKSQEVKNLDKKSEKLTPQQAAELYKEGAITGEDIKKFAGEGKKWAQGAMEEISKGMAQDVMKDLKK